MPSRVFITQRPAFRRPGGWVDKFDLTPAEKFGELVEVMPPGNTDPSIVDNMVQDLCTVLRDFSDRDYLLPLGDPAVIAAAAMAAARAGSGRVNILRWDKRAGEYEVLTVRL